MEKQITARIQSQILLCTKPVRGDKKGLNRQFVMKKENKQDVLKDK